MANSNVRSAEYRAAGGRQWNRVKATGRGIRQVIDEKRMTRSQTFDRQRSQDKDDKYLSVKARIREELAQGYDEKLVKVVPEGKRAKRKARH